MAVLAILEIRLLQMVSTFPIFQNKLAAILQNHFLSSLYMPNFPCRLYEALLQNLQFCNRGQVIAFFAEKNIFWMTAQILLFLFVQKRKSQHKKADLLKKIFFIGDGSIKLHANQFSDFLGKPCLNRPADSLRCLPMTAVRPVPYRNLQSNDTKFLHFVPFCFFQMADSDFLLDEKAF